MLEIRVSQDLDKLVSWAKWVAEDQIPFVTAQALTWTAQDIRSAEQVGMQEEFDRPTRFTLNALYVRPATKQRLIAEVWLKDTGDAAARQYLRTEIEGGQRSQKRFEAALQRAGLMPQGFIAVPGTAQELDAYGNVPAKLIVQLLSYLGAFSEQGYKANMTDKRKASLAKRVRSEQGFVKINGVEYFISRGRGEYTGRGSWKHGQHQHLAAGIWARTGTHGSNVRPVFLFVPKASYRKRFTFYERAQATFNARFIPNWRRSWSAAMASRARL